MLKLINFALKSIKLKLITLLHRLEPVNTAIINIQKAIIELTRAILQLDLTAYISRESENNPPTILSDTTIIEDKISDDISFSSLFSLMLTL